jgi:hypothetical protein
MKYTLPMKIEIELEPKAHKTDKSIYIKSILDLLDNKPDYAFSSTELINAVGSGGAVYGAIYRLAITQQIQFYSKRYHHVPSKIKGSFIVRSIKSKTALYGIKSLYKDEEIIPTTLIPTTPTPIQQPLWASVEDMGLHELTDLINKAETARLELMLKQRYEGADFIATQSVCDVLRKYKVADPIALLYIGDDCSFATYTATKQMPIVITAEINGQVKTMSCAHVTLHGNSLVKAIADSSKT